MQIREDRFDSDTRLHFFQWVALPAHDRGINPFISFPVCTRSGRNRFLAACRARAGCRTPPAYLMSIFIELSRLYRAVTTQADRFRETLGAWISGTRALTLPGLPRCAHAGKIIAGVIG